MMRRAHSLKEFTVGTDITVLWGSQRCPAEFLEDRGDRALVRFTISKQYPFSDDVDLEILKVDIEGATHGEQEDHKKMEGEGKDHGKVFEKLQAPTGHGHQAR